LARTNALPWLMATGDDLRWPATEGQRPAFWVRWIHWYLDKVIALATTHPAIAREFAQVAHLTEPPHKLLHPHIITRVLAGFFQSAGRLANGRIEI
jgi:hypothetical protein